MGRIFYRNKPIKMIIKKTILRKFLLFIALGLLFLDVSYCLDNEIPVVNNDTKPSTDTNVTVIISVLAVSFFAFLGCYLIHEEIRLLLINHEIFLTEVAHLEQTCENLIPHLRNAAGTLDLDRSDKMLLLGIRDNLTELIREIDYINRFTYVNPISVDSTRS